MCLSIALRYAARTVDLCALRLCARPRELRPAVRCSTRAALEGKAVQKLRLRCADASLFKVAPFAAALERGYRSMWDAHEAAGRSFHIALSPPSELRTQPPYW